VKKVFDCPKKALNFFIRDTADVLLTDIRMPYMSGIELIRRIKEDTRNKTIMCLLSAYRDFTYAHEGMSLGVKYYLIKPTSFEEIGSTFQKIRQELDEKMPAGTVLHSDVLSDSENNIIRQACAIMTKRTSTCSLFSIAGEIGIDASYLSRLFKKETGEKFRDRLLKIKMEQAVEMLKNSTNYKTRDISGALGYHDVQNFYRAFKKYFGMSPGELKQRLLKHEKSALSRIYLT
jgi:YesN/AraC family two-component response regulator